MKCFYIPIYDCQSTVIKLKLILRVAYIPWVGCNMVEVGRSLIRNE